MAHRTPVLRSATLDEAVGASVALKMESFQRSGSFKFRGAWSRLAAMDPETLRRGVVAYSSGNHGQAVALAARLAGTRATVLVPQDAAPVKTAAVAHYGAEILTYVRGQDDRVGLAESLCVRRGLTLVPPYEDRLVMAGQGTAALELLDEVGELDVLLVPVGGGGLVAGCAVATSASQPGTRVVGVEPAGADDTFRSLQAGRRLSVRGPASIADGLLAETPGELTFEVNRRLLSGVLTVSEQEIAAAVVFLLTRCKVVVEPSGAVGVAALLSRRPELSGRRVGVIVSGGNVDPATLAEVVALAPAAGPWSARPCR
ncbi:MAG: threonine ammonia-lyase [Acidimicrobiales bacterium]